MRNGSAANLALVHDFLVSYGGAEKTLLALHTIFPSAPIYTLAADAEFVRQYLPAATIITSRLQSLPGGASAYRSYGLLMPTAIESFDLSPFDTVVSSSVNFAKGIIVRPATRHVCYCYSPSRPLWDRAHAYEYGGKITRHFARLWDVEAAQRVDDFVAISRHVRERIKKFYRRDADVIYPPVSQLPTPTSESLSNESYYIIVSRLVPHKNIELAIDTFNKLGHQLVIVGDGPLRQQLKDRASRNIVFTGFVDDQQLATWVAHARALLVPCEEDFGLTAAEALHLGVPVLALRKGGVLEIIEEAVTGEFFDDPIPEALADGVKRLQRGVYDPKVLRKESKKFGIKNFQKAVRKIIA